MYNNELPALATALVGEVKRSALSVRHLLPLYSLISESLTMSFGCVWVMTIAHQGLQVRVTS